MKKKRLSYFKPSILVLAASISIGLLSGCAEQNSSSNSIAVKSATAVDTTPAVQQKTNTADIGLTLPVLDALFYEEGFEQDLKTKLQLTDEQIQKLKTVSHESVAELSEDGGTEYSGSTRSAAKRSDEQMRSILGDDKAARLHQLVGERYASGDVEGLASTSPNAVPTDTRIVVNSPAYRMDVFQDGKLMKTYRVGIGYPEFPLPTGMRRAETIIFNPTWTPPDEPWVKGKFSPGKKVDAGSKDNPLGPIKIPIGLPSLIHGGKAVAKLGNFASHGCVGLTNDQVKDFTLTLAQLSGSPLTPEDIQNYGKKTTETKSVKLSKAVPVELRYETIVGEPGGLHIYRDVYERGTNTLENARRILQVYGVTYESLTEAEKAALMQALTEMNRDPQGHAIVEDISAATGANGTSSSNSDSEKREDPTKSAKAKKGKETKTVVGRKEIMVPIAALQGKGYPAPVDLNTGVKPAASTVATTHRSHR